MSGLISVGSVLGRAAKIYVQQALVLVSASVSVMLFIGILDILSLGLLPAGRLIASIVGLASIMFFAGAVVRLAADVIEIGRARTTRQLVRAALPLFGQLMLVGFVVGIAIGTLLSALSFFALVLAIGLILSVHISDGSIIAGVVIATILFLAPAVFLTAVWSVVVPVVMLERPGGLRALRRSRVLVRGNLWRVIGTILVLTIIIGFADRAVEFAGQTMMGSGSAVGAWLLVATLFAPFPMLLATIIYYDLLEPSASAATVRA